MKDFTHLKQGLSVLVEEESYIRKSWLGFFAERGMRLLAFDSAEAFLTQFKSKGEPVEFFFDQDFGSRREIGTVLAGVVRDWPGRTGTSLVTSYEPEPFEPEIRSGLLNAVLPKFPKEIFGLGFGEGWQS